MPVVKTDCRSDDGITVGLIDTIINSARLLKGRDMMPPAVQEAMRDLRHDEDVERLVVHADIDIRDYMRAEIERLNRKLKRLEKQHASK